MSLQTATGRHDAARALHAINVLEDALPGTYEKASLKAEAKKLPSKKSSTSSVTRSTVGNLLKSRRFRRFERSLQQAVV